MADSEPVATQEESENKEPEKTKEDLLKENESLKAEVEGLKQNVKDRKRDWFDPHFHIWDKENDIHDPAIISGYGGKTTFEEIYDALKENQNILLKGGCYVEAMCDDNQVIREAFWARKNMKDRRFHIIAGCDLSKSHHYVDLTLQTLTSKELELQVVGIRHILNFEPTWPKTVENNIKNKTWKENFRLLSRYGLTFDCQLNPHQMEDFYNFMWSHSGTNVVINHLGCCKNPNDDEKYKVWKTGMDFLKNQTNVYCKISMLPYMDSENWDKRDGKVHEMVKYIIKTWTPGRCMFASNYPVDWKDGVEPDRLISAFKMFSEHLTDAEQDLLWYGTARKAYRLDSKNLL